MNEVNNFLPLKDLFENCVKLTIPKGQIIGLFNNDNVYLIHSGYVKRYLIRKEGDYSTQAIYGINQIFPLTSIIKHILFKDISNEGKIYYYQTMSEVTLSSMKIVQLETALDAEPRFYKALLLQSAIRLKSNIQQLDNKSLKNARWEIAHQLVYLAEDFGVISKKGVIIGVPLTQADLASMVSISRETVSRVLSRLHKQGLINYTNGIININSIENLKNIYS